MWFARPCEALKAGKRFEISYDGFCRVVEVHAVGATKDGNEVMRVWQVRGGSNTGEQGWKLLRLDKANGGKVLEEISHAPRPGYEREDSHMITIACQV